MSILDSLYNRTNANEATAEDIKDNEAENIESAENSEILASGEVEPSTNALTNSQFSVEEALSNDNSEISDNSETLVSEDKTVSNELAENLEEKPTIEDRQESSSNVNEEPTEITEESVNTKADTPEEIDENQLNAEALLVAKKEKLKEVKKYYADIYSLIKVSSAIDFDTSKPFDFAVSADTKKKLEQDVLVFAQAALEDRYFEIVGKYYHPLPGTRQISQQDAEELRSGVIPIRIFNIIQKEAMEISDTEGVKHKVSIANIYNIMNEITVGHSDLLEKKWKDESLLESLDNIEEVQNFVFNS